MFLSTRMVAAKNFRASLKYPALVSYNKLPWEIINHETISLHQHVAPYYRQIVSLASHSPAPHLVARAHPTVSSAQRLRLLPGKVYIINGEKKIPDGFSSHKVLDDVALQFYGSVSTIAPVKGVEVLISEDLRLLCLVVSMGQAKVTAPGCSLDFSKSSTNDFCLYHYFRPNRPANELTRPLDKYYVHQPSLHTFEEFLGDEWTPKLNAPVRGKDKKATPLPKYNPPQSYLMGLAERLAVIPGNSFGRRSLMWGHWF